MVEFTAVLLAFQAQGLSRRGQRRIFLSKVTFLYLEMVVTGYIHLSKGIRLYTQDQQISFLKKKSWTDMVLHRNLSKLEISFQPVSVLSFFLPYKFYYFTFLESKHHIPTNALITLPHSKKYLHMFCIIMLTKAGPILKDD